jgi:hypothetical protein
VVVVAASALSPFPFVCESKWPAIVNETIYHVSIMYHVSNVSHHKVWVCFLVFAIEYNTATWPCHVVTEVMVGGWMLTPDGG